MEPSGGVAHFDKLPRHLVRTTRALVVIPLSSDGFSSSCHLFRSLTFHRQLTRFFIYSERSSIVQSVPQRTLHIEPIAHNFVSSGKMVRICESIASFADRMQYTASFAFFEALWEVCVPELSGIVCFVV